jgi:hypothetical protein
MRRNSSSSSRRATTKAQGCSLKDEGAQRAASSRVLNRAFETGALVKFFGLNRSSISV